MNANTVVCPGVCPTPPLSCGLYLGACLVPGLRFLRLSANRHQAICPLAFHPNTAAGLHPSSNHLEEEQRPPLLTLSLAAEGRLGSLGTLLASVKKGKWKKQPDLLPGAGNSSPWFSGVMKHFVQAPDMCWALASAKAWTRHWEPENKTQLLASRSLHSGEVDGYVHSQVHCTWK